MTFNNTVKTILESTNTDWILYFKLDARDNIYKGEYVFIPYRDITPYINAVIKKGRAMVETEDMIMYSYTRGKYEYIVFVVSKSSAEFILEQYKRKYGGGLKDVSLRLKPKTRKHFGDIIDAMER